MSGLPWYPRNSRKALDGMRHLTLEQRGAYNTILDLIYDRGSPIPDDDRWIAGQMGVSVRKWKQLRQELLSEGRIVARGEGRTAVISDELAEAEIARQSSRRKINEINGGLGGRKTAENRAVSSENNDLGPANAEADAQAPLKLIEESSVTNVTGAKAGAEPDRNKESWTRAVALLRSGGHSERAARSFFGKLLSATGLQPGDLLATVVSTEALGSPDKPSYLRRSAERIAERRGIKPEPLSPADRVASWDADTWDKAVEGFRKDGRWADAMGPRPDQRGCRAPQAILAEQGYASAVTETPTRLIA